MPSEKCLLESFLLLKETAGRSARRTWRCTHGSSLVLNPQLRKSQSGFPLCTSASKHRSVRMHWLRVVKIKAGLWVSNRSKKSTFLTSGWNRKQIIFLKLGFFASLPTLFGLPLLRIEEQGIAQNAPFNRTGLLPHHTDAGWHVGWSKHMRERARGGFWQDGAHTARTQTCR